jgi:uncharacterized protein with HEPN domain
MREAVSEIVAFVKGVKYARFIQNRMIRYAVERQLLVIGEAANRVSAEFQKTHPEIPWRQMIGLRNLLAHDYGEIKVDRIWNALTKTRCIGYFFANFGSAHTLTDPPSSVIVLTLTKLVQQSLAVARSEPRSIPPTPV